MDSKHSEWIDVQIKSQENFWAGVLFVGFGIFAMVVAIDYPFGEARRMGPGYFPTYIGIGLVVLGSIVVGMGLKIEGAKIGSFAQAWKPMFMMACAFVVFSWSIDRIGFVPGLAFLIVLGSMAGQDFRPKEVCIAAIVLIISCIGIFVYGLRLAFPLFWW